ncbi:MAG: rod shape-determining protein MreD [Ignavibacterium sp.]|nr:rod shape-determining protein MreD [Ignavibacterium sp.]MDW8376389.1 rod shape-determining protein MreD [Ignavibacteriales bacterium]
MRYSYFIPFLILVPVIIFQSVFVPLISFDNIAPDLILLLLVYYTINNNQFFGMSAGFIFGGICDLIFGTILGSMMVTKTISGFIAGYFSSENKRDIYLSNLNFTLIILLVSFIDNTIFSFFSSFDLSSNFIVNMFVKNIANSIYTAFVGLLFISIIPKRRTFE